MDFNWKNVHREFMMCFQRKQKEKSDAFDDRFRLILGCEFEFNRTIDAKSPKIVEFAIRYHFELK